MKKSTLYLKAGFNLLLYLIALLLLVFLVPKVIVFFLPFVIGWIISLLANGPVKFFEEKIKFKRKMTSAIMIVLIIAIIILAGYGLIALLVSQAIGLAGDIINRWPDIEIELQNMGNGIKNYTRGLPGGLTDSLDNLGLVIENYISNFIAGLGTPSVSFISSFAKSLPATILSIIVCLLSAYFFTVERNLIIEGLKTKLHPSVSEKLRAAYRGLKKAVGGYLKAQFKIEVVVYIITLIGLAISGVDYAIAIALMIAFLDFLPFFGAGLIMVPWAVYAFVTDNYFLAIGMIITWGVGQVVRQVIQPKIVSDSVGLPPIPTLILLYVGYMAAGFLGMIISIPLGMIFLALYEEGVFKNFTESVMILWNGIYEFRKLPKE